MCYHVPVADNNTALAQAGDAEILSGDDLQAFLNTAPDAAVKDAPVTTSNATQAEPVKLTVWGAELTPAEIEAKAESMKAEALALVQDKLGIADSFLALPENQRRVLVDTAEKLRQGINPLEAGTVELTVRPIDVPADAKVPYVAWDEMSDEAKQGHAQMSGMYGDLESKIKGLADLLAGMQQFVGQMHSKTQEQQMAEAMQLKGFAGCTVTDIQGWKAKGIADPLKAAEAGILVPAKKQEEKKAEEVPEAPKGGSQKFYDSKASGLTLEQERRLLAAGYLPSDPKDRKRLEEARAKGA